jgi:hypothetical protein
MKMITVSLPLPVFVLLLLLPLLHALPGGVGTTNVIIELDCDAYGGGSHQQSQSQSQPLLPPPPPPHSSATITSAPSDAPTAAPLCEDHFSNARGLYSTLHAPCTIKFHSISSIPKEEGRRKEEVELIDYRTSNMCSQDSVIVEIKEYLYNWQDECVGDFERCYSLEHHKYVYPFLCLPDDDEGEQDENNNRAHAVDNLVVSYHPRWQIPPGTTHISVDCTVDREVGQQTLKTKEREHMTEIRRARREEIGMKLFNWTLVFFSSLLLIYALSHFIVTPLAAAVGAARAKRRRRRRHEDDDDDDHINGERRRRSPRRISSRSRRILDRTVRTVTTATSTLSGSSSSLPLHHVPQEHVTLIVDETIEGDRYHDRREQSPRRSIETGVHRDRSSRSDDDDDGDHDDDFFSGSSTDDGGDDDSSSYDPVIDGDDDDDDDVEQRQLYEFDSQVPCDFDAVPLVCATVLHVEDAIPATVVQDGVSYS